MRPLHSLDIDVLRAIADQACTDHNWHKLAIYAAAIELRVSRETQERV